MLTKGQVVQLLRDEYPYLASEYSVRSIGLFGSCAKDTPTEASDVDIVWSIAVRELPRVATQLQEILEQVTD